MHFSGLLFFLSILEASVSAFTAVRVGSNLIKKFLRKNLVYVIFILKFTLHNLEAALTTPKKVIKIKN